jgi:hypothetical protein
MKRNTLLLAGLLAALSSGISSVKALPDSHLSAVKRAVQHVAAPEVAAKAASLVSKAETKERSDVAIAAIRVIVSQRPSLAPSVVGSISKAYPELSATVAAEAASLSKEQVEQIVRAASAAAPRNATAIAVAVAKVVPASAAKSAVTAASVVPSADSSIEEMVVAAVPAARQEVQKSMTLARTTRSSAQAGGGSGNIATFRGTIRGTLPPGTPTAIVEAQVVTSGDSDREDYGRPR